MDWSAVGRSDSSRGPPACYSGNFGRLEILARSQTRVTGSEARAERKLLEGGGERRRRGIDDKELLEAED